MHKFKQKYLRVSLLAILIIFSACVGVRMTKFAVWGDIIPFPIFPVKCYQVSAWGQSFTRCYPFFDFRFWKEPNFVTPLPPTPL